MVPYRELHSQFRSDAHLPLSPHNPHMSIVPVADLEPNRREPLQTVFQELSFSACLSYEVGHITFGKHIILVQCRQRREMPGWQACHSTCKTEYGIIYYRTLSSRKQHYRHEVEDNIFRNIYF